MQDHLSDGRKLITEGRNRCSVNEGEMLRSLNVRMPPCHMCSRSTLMSLIELFLISTPEMNCLVFFHTKIHPKTSFTVPKSEKLVVLAFIPLSLALKVNSDFFFQAFGNIYVHFIEKDGVNWFRELFWAFQQGAENAYKLSINLYNLDSYVFILYYQ